MVLQGELQPTRHCNPQWLKPSIANSDKPSIANSSETKVFAVAEMVNASQLEVQQLEVRALDWWCAAGWCAGCLFWLKCCWL